VAVATDSPAVDFPEGSLSPSSHGRLAARLTFFREGFTGLVDRAQAFAAAT
jgi:hypothetical protein